MPRFAANLGYLFTERPLIERIGAAAAAGFKAVELQFPYDVPASAVRAELERHGLTQLGINTVRGRQGESGLAALPGRERDWEASFQQALDYVTAIGGSAIHCMAGIVPPEQRPAAETVFIRNLAQAAEAAAKHNITLLIEPINPRDRPDYFLNRAEHAADIIAKIGAPNVRIQFDFYHAQILGGDLHPPLRKASSRSSATSRSPPCPRAPSRTRARSTIPRCSRRSIAPATRAGSAANTARARAPRKGSAGRRPMALAPKRS